MKSLLIASWVYDHLRGRNGYYLHYYYKSSIPLGSVLSNQVAPVLGGLWNPPAAEAVYESGTDPSADGSKIYRKNLERGTRPQSGACPPKEDRTFLRVGPILHYAAINICHHFFN